MRVLSVDGEAHSDVVTVVVATSTCDLIRLTVDSYRWNSSNRIKRKRLISELALAQSLQPMGVSVTRSGSTEVEPVELPVSARSKASLAAVVLTCCCMGSFAFGHVNRSKSQAIAELRSERSNDEAIRFFAGCNTPTIEKISSHFMLTKSWNDERAMIAIPLGVTWGTSNIGDDFQRDFCIQSARELLSRFTLKQIRMEIRARSRSEVEADALIDRARILFNE